MITKDILPKCIQCGIEKQVYQKHLCKECLIRQFRNLDFVGIIDRVRNIPRRLLRDLGVR